ncbi:MAG: crosslink repair DNA glycosylase YcaQ family protein [Capsulimonas sp.]|uniref:DNA glycosylase AlkZ-like family protein n=1 Tax=Capsulimonas sp. TaxID=2494211 RepID=UPI00326312E5
MYHADRTRIISDEFRPQVVTKNLRVLATFLVDGYAAGLWTTERKKRTATLALKPFAPLTKTAAGDLAVEGEKLLRFVEEDADTYAIQIVD